MTMEEWVDAFAKAASLREEHRDMLLLAFRNAMQEAEDVVADNLHCAFCGRPRASVRYLVQGSYGACICDECAAEALRMVTDCIIEKAGL